MYMVLDLDWFNGVCGLGTLAGNISIGERELYYVAGTYTPFQFARWAFILYNFTQTRGFILTISFVLFYIVLYVYLLY